MPSSVPTLRNGVLRMLLIGLPMLICAQLSMVVAAHELMMPATRTALPLLLPGFAVQSLDVRNSGPHWVVHAELVNDRYVVTHGHAVAPGGKVSASTSARRVLLWALMPLIVLGVVPPRSRQGLLVALVAGGLLGLGLYGLFLPVVLAGVLWSLIAPEQAHAFSLEGLLIQASDATLHGFAYAILAAWAATLVGMRSSRIGRQNCEG